MSKNSPYILLEDSIVTGGRVIVRGMPDMTAREKEDSRVIKWSSAPGNKNRRMAVVVLLYVLDPHYLLA